MNFSTKKFLSKKNRFPFFCEKIDFLSLSLSLSLSLFMFSLSSNQLIFKSIDRSILWIKKNWLKLVTLHLFMPILFRLFVCLYVVFFCWPNRVPKNTKFYTLWIDFFSPTNTQEKKRDHHHHHQQQQHYHRSII